MDARFIAACASPAQFPPETLPEIAVVGRSNCGKSSLLNALVGRRVARTSSTPGRTRQIVFFAAQLVDTPPFHLVDLPGYGYARVSRDERDAWAELIERYIEHRGPLVAMLLLVDVRRAAGADEAGLLEWCRRRGIAAVVVLTKADKASKSERFAARERARRELGLSRRPEVVSVKDPRSIGALRRAVGRLLPNGDAAPAGPGSAPRAGGGALVVGLTGGIGAGKTAVARTFAELGAQVVDADQLARDVVGPGSAALAAIVDAFGPEVLDAAGALDRRRMRQLIFSDAEARARLEAITHPAIQRAAGERFEQLAAAGHRVVLYEAALLVEAGRHRQVDRLITVIADDDLRVARLVLRDGVSSEEARRMIAAQLPQDRKAALADYVIDNSGSMEETRAQVADVLEQLRAAAAATTPEHSKRSS